MALIVKQRQLNLSGRDTDTQDEGTLRKLATATQPQFPRIVISVQHVLLNGAAHIEVTARRCSIQ
jgi:hypothetical protein